MKKLLAIFISIFALFGFTSCEKEPAEFNVTFEENGGSVVNDVVVEEGKVILMPAKPTKEGYTFAGWYTDAELTTEWAFTNVVTSEITLYAKWERDTTTVKEALDICAKLESGDKSSVRYLIEATVDSITNPTYGAMIIKDETGEIKVYGSYGADGQKRYSELDEKPYAGDKVLLSCVLQNFNGSYEIYSAWILEFEHVEIEINEADYKEMSIAEVRTSEKATKAKVSGVVARITYANGMIPSGFYLVDNTNAIYVYDSQIASRVEVGNKVTVLGEKDQWILETEMSNAAKFGYKGCTQITNCILKENDNKTDNKFDKSWITESTVKAMIDTPVTTDISSTIFKVNALVKKTPGNGFTNYYFYDLDGETGSYTYTQCNGNDFTWLDEFDGKICTVYLSALNAKSTAASAYWRFIPVEVIDENFTFDINNAAKFAVEYFAEGQFKANYTGDPAVEVVTTVDSTLLGFTGATITYSSNNTDAVYFETVEGVTKMHCKNPGKAVITITAVHGSQEYSSTVDIEVLELPKFDSVTVAEAIASQVDDMVTVRGVVAGSLVNQVGFYIVDETGAIAVKTDADTLANIELGHEVVMKGTRTQFKAENGKPGQACLLDSTLVANLYGEHEYSTASFDNTKSLAEIIALEATPELSTKVFSVQVQINFVETTFYSNMYIVDGETQLLLYTSSGNQYSWLKQFTGQTITVELLLCDWNAKGYKGAVIAAYGSDGVKVFNALNFQ